MITPALTGGMNYKGFAEVSYIKGIGHKNADFLEFSTTQGLKYRDWFFMGVGAGVDVLFSNAADDYRWDGAAPSRDLTKTAVMIPLYSDFRFNIGSMKNTGFFIDLRLGCEFLVGNDYIRIGDGYLTNSECFYFRPSVGLRVPLSDTNPKQAVNFGVSYKLITSNYWYGYSNNCTLNGLGVNVSFEW